MSDMHPTGPVRNTRAKKRAYWILRRHIRRVRKRREATFDLKAWENER